ncbi:MAG: hypothetical protein U5K36_07330 [Roseovarius sp.]|nr:hypothetical protein [Roseovarius sp.]
MSPERVPVFLARRSYRRRRVADAARLSAAGGRDPFLRAAALAGGADGARTVSAMIYVFGLWAVLVVLSAVLSRHLRGEEDERGGEDGGGAQE